MKTLLKKSEFPHVKNLKNTKILLDPQKLEPRVVDPYIRSVPGGGVLQGLVWVGDHLTFHE